MCIKQINSELVCINCGYTKEIIINSEKSLFLKIHLEKRVILLTKE